MLRRFRFRNLPLRQKLFLVQSALLGLIFVAGQGALQYCLETYDDVIRQSSAAVVATSMAGMESELRAMEKLNFNLTFDTKIQDQLRVLKDSPATYERMLQLSGLSDKIRLASLSEKDLRGVVFCDSRRAIIPLMTDSVTMAPETIQSATAATEGHEGQAVWLGPASGSPHLLLVREVLDSGKDLLGRLGYLILVVDIQRIAQRYVAALPYEVRGFALLDHQNPLFSRGAALFDFSAYRPKTHPVDYQQTELSGQRYFVVSKESDDSGWTYVSLLPYDQIFGRSNALRLILLGFFALMLLMTLAVSVTLARSITGPLEKLAETMRGLESALVTSDQESAVLSLRVPDVPLSDRADEIGVLSRDLVVMVERINTLVKENMETQLLARESEYRLLQAQINPHFLYNTLNSINWLARANKQKEISLMVESLSTLLRAAIRPTILEHTVGEEVSLLESYLHIQKTRYKDRIGFEMHIGEEHLGLLLPSFAFQALVENSIRYGVEARTAPVRIVLSSRAQDDLVWFSVEDDGPGFEAEAIEQVLKADTPGIGLKNINSRLQMVYGRDHALQIESTPGRGTRVRFSIPGRR